MNPQQEQAYQETMILCKKLIRRLEQDKDDAQRMFKGELRETYLKATDAALKKVRDVQNALRNAQSMQL